MNNKSIGRLGEDLACQFLVKKGYTILGRNYRKPWGEIDIVARAPDRALVFVEVKTMKRLEGRLAPEDQMTRSKNKKLRRVCQEFAARNPEMIDEKRGWRIDMVAIEIKEGGENDIRHYEVI